jgi:hypothetical protein
LARKNLSSCRESNIASQQGLCDENPKLAQTDLLHRFYNAGPIYVTSSTSLSLFSQISVHEILSDLDIFYVLSSEIPGNQQAIHATIP